MIQRQEGVAAVVPARRDQAEKIRMAVVAAYGVYRMIIGQEGGDAVREFRRSRQQHLFSRRFHPVQSAGKQAVEYPVAAFQGIDIVIIAGNIL